MKSFSASASPAEFFRFVCIGAVNTVASYLLYCLLLEFAPYALAYTASYVASIFLSYVLNCRFVFRRKPTWSGAIRFPAVYLVQYALGIALLAFFIKQTHWSERLAAAVVAACSIPVTFLLSRLIIRGKDPASIR